MKTFFKAVLAGMLIGIGGIIFISLENKIMGSFLFSFGLLSICVYGLNLYTGKIGYFFENDKQGKLNYLLIILGNYIGATLVGLLFSLVLKDNVKLTVETISAAKLDNDWYKILILSIFCGIMMFLAVDLFKKAEGFLKAIPVFMGVMIFILSGFEHCVANMFYFACALSFTLKTYLYILIMIVGNSIGSLLIWSLKKISYKDEI